MNHNKLELHPLSDIKSLKESAIELQLNYYIISGIEAQNYLKAIYKKYVFYGAHPQIDEAKSIPFEENETSFSSSMNNKPAYLFTKQEDGYLLDQNIIFVIENAQDIAKLLYNTMGGPEIYASDADMTYAIAVNWYSIHYIGNIDLKKKI